MGQERLEPKGDNEVPEATLSFQALLFTPSLTVLFQASNLCVNLILPLLGIFKQRTFVT